jgi:predicted TIM-barrel fold metal-dependent hydrolase
MLARHPNLRVVGAHLGSMEWSVDELAKRLDKFPNFAVDMSARICHFQVQDREKVRNFIIKYQDRLLYGTDDGVSENDNIQKACQQLHQTWLDDWEYFSTDKAMTSSKVNGTFKGLKLDIKVLRKIYYENAVTWLPEMRK